MIKLPPNGFVKTFVIGLAISGIVFVPLVLVRLILFWVFDFEFSLLDSLDLFGILLLMDLATAFVNRATTVKILSGEDDALQSKLEAVITEQGYVIESQSESTWVIYKTPSRIQLLCWLTYLRYENGLVSLEGPRVHVMKLQRAIESQIDILFQESPRATGADSQERSRDQVDMFQTTLDIEKQRRTKRQRKVLFVATLAACVLWIVLMVLFDDVLPCTLPLAGLVLVQLLTSQFFRTEIQAMRESGRAVHRTVPGLPAQKLPTSKPDKVLWKRFFPLFGCTVVFWILIVGLVALIASDEINQRGWRALIIFAFPSVFLPPFVVAFQLLAFSRTAYIKDHPSFWRTLAKGIGILLGWGVFAVIATITMVWLTSLVKNPVVFTLMVLAAGLAAVFVLAFSVTWLPTLWTAGALRRANYSAALRRVRLLRRFQPRSPLFLYLHGTVLSFAGHHAEAEKLLRESLAEGQNNPSLARAQGNALENLGYALLEQQRYGEAIQAFEGSIEIIPESAGPYSGLAEVYLRQGIKPERALELIEKALEHKLRSYLTRHVDRQRLGEMWGNHAWALAMLGRHAEASKSLQCAFKEVSGKHKPRLAAVCYRAGQVMRLRGAKSAATEYLERAREIDPQGAAGNLAAHALTEGHSQQE